MTRNALARRALLPWTVVLLAACGGETSDGGGGERLRRDAQVAREVGPLPEDAQRPAPDRPAAGDVSPVDAGPPADAVPGDFDAEHDARGRPDEGASADGASGDAAPGDVDAVVATDLGFPADIPDWGDVSRPAPWPEPGPPPGACAEPVAPGDEAPARLRVEADAPGLFGGAGAAHDAAGRLVVATRAGDLYRIDPDGTRSLWVAGVARKPRGMAFLSTGELVLADSALGRLVLVYPQGEVRTLSSDLDAPMDVEVDARDFVYVSEATRGAIREVDPITRRSRRVIDALPVAPGALAFSADQRQLFVALSGSGTVFVTERDAAGDFGELRPFARLAENDLRCVGLAEGAACGPGAACRRGIDGVLACIGEGICRPEDIGQPCGGGGICLADGLGGVACRGDTACDGHSAGDICVMFGLPGMCAPEVATGQLVCGPPACTGRSPGEACTDLAGAPGRCADNLAGRLYCQSDTPCEGRLESAACLDRARNLRGICTRAGRRDLYCATTNPCDGEVEGARCTSPLDGRAGLCAMDLTTVRLYCLAPSDAPCAGAVDGQFCVTPAGRPGLCFDTTEARICFDPEPCFEQGQACTAAQGQPGTCEPDPQGALFCRAAFCFGALDGAPCQDEAFGAGQCVEGTCLPVGVCEAVPDGGACRSPRTGAPGRCGAGAGDARLCLPEEPCAALAEGEACEARAGLTGTCTVRAPGEAPSCDVGRLPGVVLALETDVCGHVYATDDATESVWRISPDGSERQRMAAPWRGPVTTLTWAPPGADAAGELLAVVRGGADVLALTAARPARPTVRPLVDVVAPRGRPDARAAACLAAPDAPVAQRPVPGGRGYHDVVFDATGLLIGFDGASLVSVDAAGQTAVVAAGLQGAEGMDRLPDESIVVATGAGLVRVFPNGAQLVIAPDVRAYGVTVGPDGRVYAGDNGGTIWRVDADTLEVEPYWQDAAGRGIAPRTIAFDPDHSLLYFGVFGDRVYSMPVGPDLEPLAEPRPLAVVGGGAFLDGLTVDTCGQLYLPRYEESALYRVTPDGDARLYFQWDRTQYGHGLEWGRGLGGFSREALYFPQPYNGNSVLEMTIGVRGARD
jgi:sugar lactone lactonase YvrE